MTDIHPILFGNLKSKRYCLHCLLLLSTWAKSDMHGHCRQLRQKRRQFLEQKELGVQVGLEILSKL